jgi:transposase
MSIPSVGPITASVLMANLGNGQQYKQSRDFAAATGLVPSNTALAADQHC